MKAFKIVILGSVGAGKSTLVRAISRCKVAGADVKNADPASDELAATTVFDYADIALPDGDRLRLYGAPGEECLEFVWPMLLQGAEGVVIMVDATREPLESEVERYLKVTRAAGDMPLVCGLSRLDLAEGDLQEYTGRMAEVIGRGVPLIPVDARSEDQVLMLMDVLVSEMESTQLMGTA